MKYLTARRSCCEKRLDPLWQPSLARLLPPDGLDMHRRSGTTYYQSHLRIRVAQAVPRMSLPRPGEAVRLAIPLRGQPPTAQGGRRVDPGSHLGIGRTGQLAHLAQSYATVGEPRRLCVARVPRVAVQRAGPEVGGFKLRREENPLVGWEGWCLSSCQQAAGCRLPCPLALVGRWQRRQLARLLRARSAVLGWSTRPCVYYRAISQMSITNRLKPSFCQ